MIVQRAIILLAALALAACGPDDMEPTGPRACESALPEQSGIIRWMAFEVAEDGVSEGFDLDESLGPTFEASACRARDFVDADGRDGIDNQLTPIIPALENQVGEGTLDALLQSSISNGQLLIGLTLEGLDDPRNDDCVTLVVRTLTGTPLLGTDGMLLDGQTLQVSPEARTARYEGAVLRDGVLETGPFELALPVSILDARFVLDLHGARVRVRIHEDGSMSGVFAGGISNDQMIEIASGLNIGEDLMSTVATFIRLIADLEPVDGKCTQFSASMVFEAGSGFVDPL
ncbi:Hypothetical protein I5071_32920 [Sandaracinus amylolyticus]|nr:Hypothetical protein I5071_32920 [Sandaracinus amylolyticus]